MASPAFIHADASAKQVIIDNCGPLVPGMMVPENSATMPLLQRASLAMHKARIGGIIRWYLTPEQTFKALKNEWARLRGHGSSTAELVNDAYGQIVAMGWAVVPYLLREVQMQSGHWFEALTWITREDLATPEIRGNIRELRRAWIRGGMERGFIADDNLSGPMVQGQPQVHSRI